MRQLLGTVHLLLRGAAILGLACTSAPAQAMDLARSTYILGIHQGSALSSLAEGLGIGGYQLRDESWVYFYNWYHSGWKDMTVDMMTQTSDDFGILWSLSTGERGEKYIIDPSVKLGFIDQIMHPTPSSAVTLTVTSTLWGNFTELPCQADYGDIGGIQTANCRLAANEMAPEETLKYLVKSEPSRLKITIGFNASF